MIKTLAKQIKDFKKASIITPVFMILEVLFETLIPFLMASIIDEGVEAGNMHHIYVIGTYMIVAALCGGHLLHLVGSHQSHMMIVAGVLLVCGAFSVAAIRSNRNK